jgi:hypothetical protein
MSRPCGIRGFFRRAGFEVLEFGVHRQKKILSHLFTIRRLIWQQEILMSSPSPQTVMPENSLNHFSSGTSGLVESQICNSTSC